MKVFVVTHPEVQVDKAVPVPRWSLRALGIERMRAAARRPALASVGAVWSSDETKAIEAAGLLAAAHGLPVQVHPGLAEIDRSATGFLPHDEHDATADACFAQPQESVRGWERAIDAQKRMVETVEEILSALPAPSPLAGEGCGGGALGQRGSLPSSTHSAQAPPHPGPPPRGGREQRELALVTHGGVATLLLCHLLGVPIDRKRDQPGQGHVFTFDADTRAVLSDWQRIEELDLAYPFTAPAVSPAIT